MYYVRALKQIRTNIIMNNYFYFLFVDIYADKTSLEITGYWFQSAWLAHQTDSGLWADVRIFEIEP